MCNTAPTSRAKVLVALITPQLLYVCATEALLASDADGDALFEDEDSLFTGRAAAVAAALPPAVALEPLRSAFSAAAGACGKVAAAPAPPPSASTSPGSV